MWKLNVAHVFFMQQEAKFEAKFKDAIRYYEPAVRRRERGRGCSLHHASCPPIVYPPQVKKHWDSILDVTAIVLANLCVSYIMTTQVG